MHPTLERSRIKTFSVIPANAGISERPSHSGEIPDQDPLRYPGERRDLRAQLPPLSADEHLTGFVRELLSPPRNANLQVIRTVMPPGYSNRSRPFRHLGVKSVHVLKGRLRVFSDTDEYLLETGDTLTYDCSTPHWWENPDDRAAVILGSVIPLGPLPLPRPRLG